MLVGPHDFHTSVWAMYLAVKPQNAKCTNFGFLIVVVVTLNPEPEALYDSTLNPKAYDNTLNPKP